MIKHKNLGIGYQGYQNRMEAEFMANPNPSLSTSYNTGLQTYEYNPPIVYEGDVVNPFSVTNPYLFWLDESHKQLGKIRQEAKEAFAVDNEIDSVPESAYDDALSLLEVFFHFSVPMPELSWAEDGSLTLGWYPEEGTITIGVYGDDLVIFTAFFEEKRQFEGICALSDTPMLFSFLEVLTNILM